MLNKRIELWNKGEYAGEMQDGFYPFMDTYVLDGEKPRPAVVVCPGGGYSFTSPREAEPIAIKFNAAGFHAFVLYYSVSPRRHPQPLLDLSRAMCIIRENSDAWKVEPGKIAVCGFSAGGHLAASLGVHWDKHWLKGIPGIKEGMNKPNAMILAYPVIMPKDFAHKGSFINLLGNMPPIELIEEMSLEKQVSDKTPPAFIWHTFADNAVPVENSMIFAQELRRNNIPFELHIYPEGPHGLSLAEKETAQNPGQINKNVASWLILCINWLNYQFIKEI